MDEAKYRESKRLLERAKNVLAGGVSSEFRKYGQPHALFYSHGKGSYIYDVDGNAYLDFTLSQGPLIVGHAHPHVLEAVNAYSENGQLFAGQHIKELELAETLQRLIPSAERMRFCLDGSTAVQTAFRIARAKTGKPKFLRFEGQYHGWLDNVGYGINGPDLPALGDRANPQVFAWTEGLPPHSRDEFIILPWNDLDLVKATLQQHHHEIAAIITEPVMCNQGCISPKEGFLEGLRDCCDLYGIALIFDEVITGFRLSLGGAQAFYGVTPDLSIFAKAIGSGYPISAIVGKREWMQLLENGRVIHAGTMNSSNATVAAALATIEVLERDEKTYERMFCLGKRLMQGLRQAAELVGLPLLVQGPGPMCYMACTEKTQVLDYRDIFSIDKDKTAKLVGLLHEAGIRILTRGLWYISAVHTEADIDLAIARATTVFREFK